MDTYKAANGHLFVKSCLIGILAAEMLAGLCDFNIINQNYHCFEENRICAHPASMISTYSGAGI